jgi:hypothetical protein
MGIKGHGQNDAYGATVAGQTAFPDLEDIPGIFFVEIPGIKKDMTQPGPNDDSDDDVNKEAVYPAGFDFLIGEHFGHHDQSYVKSDGKEQAVPTDFPVTNEKNVGSEGPGNVVQHGETFFEHPRRKLMAKIPKSHETGTENHGFSKNTEKSKPTCYKISQSVTM